MTFWSRNKQSGCYYTVVALVLMALSFEVLRYRSSSSIPSTLLYGSSRRKERKHSGGWSGRDMQDKELSTTFGSYAIDFKGMSKSKHQPELPVSSVNVDSSSAAVKKLLVKGKPVRYITPPSPNVLVPDVRSMAGAPTKPSIQFHFAHPNLVKNPEEIFASPWLSRLHEMLRSMPHRAKQVSVVFSDSNYTESLLNWLIASRVRLRPPLMNLIVVCLDKVVFDLLDHRDIPSILLEPAMVLKHDAQLQLEDVKLKFSYIWVLRLVVYRLITYFGYDVVSYDADAVMIRNLQPLLDKYQDRDIVGSVGKYPFSLGRQWGFTMCMGVIRFRSGPNTELMWELMSTIRSKQVLYDDQVRLNYALKQCGIQWQSIQHPSSSIKKKPISGQCSLRPYQRLRVTVLPNSDICRHCEEKQDYFVVHPNSKKTGAVKVDTAMKTHLWFLRKDWRRIGDGGSSLKGVEWLAALMDT